MPRTPTLTNAEAIAYFDRLAEAERAREQLEAEQEVDEDDDSSDEGFEDVPINSAIPKDARPIPDQPGGNDKAKRTCALQVEDIAGVSEFAGGTGACSTADDSDTSSDTSSQASAVAKEVESRANKTRRTPTKPKHKIGKKGRKSKKSTAPKLTRAGKRQKKLNDMTEAQRDAFLRDEEQKKLELKEKGYTEGTPEAAPLATHCKFDFDVPIPEDDPYFRKGCERRMVFSSELVPQQHQYKHYDGKAEDKPTFLKAFDKAHHWIYTRPNSGKRGQPDWDEAGYNDGRRPRHFVLKMGPPNGFVGHADAMAARLKSMWQQFFRMRLKQSHVTVEIEVPYIRWGVTGYFKSFMDTVLEMTDKKKFGHRLTIELAHGSTEAWMNADPQTFYMKPIDIDAEWQKILSDTTANTGKIQGLARPGKLYEHRQPYLDEIEDAEKAFRRQNRNTMETDKETINEAIEDIQKFIQRVRRFELSKDPSYIEELEEDSLAQGPTVDASNAPGTAQLSQIEEDQLYQEIALGLVESETEATSQQSAVTTTEIVQPAPGENDTESPHEQDIAPDANNLRHEQERHMKANLPKSTLPGASDMNSVDKYGHAPGYVATEQVVIADPGRTLEPDLQHDGYDYQGEQEVSAGWLSPTPYARRIDGTEFDGSAQASHGTPQYGSYQESEYPQQQHLQIQGDAQVSYTNHPSGVYEEPPKAHGHTSEPAQTPASTPELQRLRAHAFQAARSAVTRAQQQEASLRRDDPLMHAPWAQGEQQRKWQRTFQAVYNMFLERLIDNQNAKLRTVQQQPLAHAPTYVDDTQASWDDLADDGNVTIERLRALPEEINRMESNQDSGTVGQGVGVTPSPTQMISPPSLSQVPSQRIEQALHPSPASAQGKRKRRDDEEAKGTEPLKRAKA